MIKRTITDYKMIKRTIINYINDKFKSTKINYNKMINLKVLLLITIKIKSTIINYINDEKYYYY